MRQALLVARGQAEVWLVNPGESAESDRLLAGADLLPGSTVAVGPTALEPGWPC